MRRSTLFFKNAIINLVKALTLIKSRMNHLSSLVIQVLMKQQ